MTTFDEREKAYEKQFSLDDDLKFKARSRSTKAVAEWAGTRMGITGPALEVYLKEVLHAYFNRKAEDDVLRKIKGDLAANGIKVDDCEIRSMMRTDAN
jgi:hypothetical protein